jgi:hypothetical protein
MSFMPEAGNDRCGYAPRRGRGGWSRPFVKRQDPVKPDISRNPLGELLVSLQTSDLVPPPARSPSSPGIGNCQYVASYNWLVGKETTIAIPGEYCCLTKAFVD